MKKDTIQIDVSAIPAHVRDDLAAATLGLMRGILAQPGGRELLEEKKAERAKRKGRNSRFL